MSDTNSMFYSEETFQGVQSLIKESSDYIIDNAQKEKILGTKSNLTLKSNFNFISYLGFQNIKSVQRIYTHYISAGLKQVGSDKSFDQMRESLVQISNDLIDIMIKSKSNIKKLAKEFLSNGQIILLFSYSSAVSETLIEGAKNGIKFQCLIAESRPDCSGYKYYQELQDQGILCKMFVDSTLGTSLEKVDIVLCGAETVVENGGIINKAGTYTVALCAKYLKVPFYVVSESYKFTRAIYPLQQTDLPQYLQQNDDIDIVDNSFIQKSDSKTKVEFLNPSCDYTPPELITLLVTDLGIIKPSAVTDELIQTFND